MEISATLSLHSIHAPRSISSSSSISSSNSLFFNGGGGGRTSDFSLKKKNRLVLNRSNKRQGLNCRCMFGLGVPEIVVIAGVATLLFGPKKLPEIGRSIGQTFKSFQQAAKEFEIELKKDQEPEPEPEPVVQLPPVEKPTVDIEEKKQGVQQLPHYPESEPEPIVEPPVEKPTVDSEEKKQGVQV